MTDEVVPVEPTPEAAPVVEPVADVDPVETFADEVIAFVEHPLDELAKYADTLGEHTKAYLHDLIAKARALL